VSGDDPQDCGDVGIPGEHHEPPDGLEDLSQEHISFYVIRPRRGIVHPAGGGLGLIRLLPSSQLDAEGIADPNEVIFHCFSVAVQLRGKLLAPFG
jgi:hypothetical protein